jgi:hypothetical protein
MWDSNSDDIYLIAQLPEDLNDSIPYPLTIQQNRAHVFQFDLPSGLYINSTYPWSRFDDEDILFFLPESEDRGCDGIVAIISCLKDFTIGEN